MASRICVFFVFDNENIIQISCWVKHVIYMFPFKLCFLLSCVYYYPVSLPRGAIGWSVVCDLAFSGHIHVWVDVAVFLFVCL